MRVSFVLQVTSQKAVVQPLQYLEHQGRVTRQQSQPIDCQGDGKSASLVQLSPDATDVPDLGGTTSAVQTHVLG